MRFLAKKSPLGLGLASSATLLANQDILNVYLYVHKNLGTAARAHCAGLPFLIGQVSSRVWCRPYLATGFFELRTYHPRSSGQWSWSIGTNLPLHFTPDYSRFEVKVYTTEGQHCFYFENLRVANSVGSVGMMTFQSRSAKVDPANIHKGG